MAIYVHCPSGTFSEYVDFPWNGIPSSGDSGQLAAADIYLLVEITPPSYDAATQNLLLLDPVEAPVDTWTQTWSVTAKTTQEQDDYQEGQRRAAAIAAIKADTPVKNLLKATPEQIDTYFTNNVNDLASARTAMNIMARALAVTAQTLFDE